VRAGETVVTVAPMTHAPPAELQGGIEIPSTTKIRLGLDDRRTWVIVTEVNQFIWPGPDLRPISRHRSNRFDYGVLPPSLFERIKETVLETARHRRLRATPRQS
jgi:hypothetical protein